jgi:malonyl CoA-acyl carrier protein transacylase
MHDIHVRNSYLEAGKIHTGALAWQPARAPAPTPAAAPAKPPAQDRELLLLDAGSIADLRGRIAYLAESASTEPGADVHRLAVTLQRELTGAPVRAAVVVSEGQAVDRLTKLLAALDAGERTVLDLAGGVFAGRADDTARIGFLFPGQGSGRGDAGGALAQHFATVRDVRRRFTVPEGADPAATEVAQPRIALGSVAGLRVLSLLGIEATMAVGHSLGELAALHWAGAMREADLMALASARGAIMAGACAGTGAMASLAAGGAEVERVLAGEPVVIAGYNGPAQTVVAGPADAVERVRAAATDRGIKAIKLAVSDAFHSPAMAPAADELRAYLAGQRFRTPAGRVVSTVTGDVLTEDVDLKQLLVSQLCDPVRFHQALTRMAAEVDLLIEVGPGRVLSGLAAKTVPGVPVIPLLTDGASLSGVLNAVAAAYVLGAPVRHDQLSSAGSADAAHRFVSRTRSFVPGRELVAEAELCADSDPYVAEHRLGTEPQFPAVLALEAIAQAAAPLDPGTGAEERALVFENVEFLHPIVVPADGSVTIRIAARREGDQINVAIRSSETGFGTAHVKAAVRCADGRPPSLGLRRALSQRDQVPLDPARDLYGGILPRSTRFQRVRGYRSLAASSCVVEICMDAGDAWFAEHHPPGLLLGDPGTRDAFMHAIASCVPDATLLPTAIRRLYPARLTGPAGEARKFIVYAAERRRAGDTHTYDVDVYGAEGRLLERWEGLRLLAVRSDGGSGPWAPALVGPYLERQLADQDAYRVRCAVEPDTADPETRRKQTAAAVSRMLGRPALVWHRRDGRPEIAEEGLSVRVAHGAGVALTVTSTAKVSCDIRAVRENQAEPEASLIALAELIARAAREPMTVATTRLHGALACLKDIGWTGKAPLTFAGSGGSGWVTLGAGPTQIATFSARLRDNPSPVMFTILTEGCAANEPLLRIPALCRVRGNRHQRPGLPRQLPALAGPVPGDVPARVRAYRARRAPRLLRADHSRDRF